MDSGVAKLIESVFPKEALRSTRGNGHHTLNNMIALASFNGNLDFHFDISCKVVRDVRRNDMQKDFLAMTLEWSPWQYQAQEYRQ